MGRMGMNGRRRKQARSLKYMGASGAVQRSSEVLYHAEGIGEGDYERH